VSFTVLACPQRSDAWRAARCGRLTASVAAAAVARGKGATEAVTRRDLRYRLACERLTGVPEPDDFLGWDMRRGINLEPEALLAYESATQTRLEKTGFLAHDTLPIGCSLDGHVGRFEHLVEVKTAKPSIHIRRFHEREAFVAEHRAQICHALWVTGAEDVELVSYSPLLPPALRLLRVLVPRDQAGLDEYVPAAEAFLADVERTVEEIEAMAAA